MRNLRSRVDMCGTMEYAYPFGDVYIIKAHIVIYRIHQTSCFLSIYQQDRFVFNNLMQYCGSIIMKQGHL